jgi:hypothetical protein
MQNIRITAQKIRITAQKKQIAKHPAILYHPAPMNAELDLRLKAFNRSLDMLALPEYSALWKGKAPEVFTAKHEEATAMVAALEDAAKKQQAGLGGVTDEKEREETELEDVAFMVAQAMLLWFNDKKQETEAGEMDMAKSVWQGLRDQQLLTKSQRVIDLATSLTSGGTAADAAKYGITPAVVTMLIKERKDYDDIVNAPGVAQTVRKALTKGFRPAFALVEKKFGQLDSLIIQFGTTAAGKAMVSAWNDARVQKGQSNASRDAKPAAPAAPGTPPAN